jgi:hypothetical protein
MAGEDRDFSMPSVNWGDVYSAIAEGKSIPTSKSTTQPGGGGIMEPEPISMDMDALAEKSAALMGYNKTASSSGGQSMIKNANISPILYEINKYKFSSSNVQKDVEETALIIREALRKRMAQKIMKNTKDLCKYAGDFFQGENSMRGVFNILGNKYSMKATGEFSGEECLYCSAQGNEILGGVFTKDATGDYVDISKSFTIEITKK